MCSVCMTSPCLSGCPNAEEQEPVFNCGRCGYGIFPGDQYIESGAGYVCRDCLEDMSVEEILDLCDMALETAERKE